MFHFFEIKRVKIGVLLFGLMLLNSCGNNPKNNSELPITEESNAESEKSLLVGSWKDSSPTALHFTLFANGTARSDNMATLLYQHWRVSNNNIIFTVKSIGNKTSSITDTEYEIQKLTKDELILKSGDVLYAYTKSATAGTTEEKFVDVNTDKLNEVLARADKALSALEAIKLYYPVKIETGEGNEEIKLTERIKDNTNTVITVVHDNLLDDSLKAEKHVIELKRTNGGNWIIISIKKNWKCRIGRGHEGWGIEFCS